MPLHLSGPCHGYHPTGSKCGCQRFRYPAGAAPEDPDCPVPPDARCVCSQMRCEHGDLDDPPTVPDRLVPYVHAPPHPTATQPYALASLPAWALPLLNNLPDPNIPPPSYDVQGSILATSAPLYRDPNAVQRAIAGVAPQLAVPSVEEAEAEAIANRLAATRRNFGPSETTNQGMLVAVPPKGKGKGKGRAGGASVPSLPPPPANRLIGLEVVVRSYSADSNNNRHFQAVRDEFLRSMRSAELTLKVQVPWNTGLVAFAHYLAVQPVFKQLHFPPPPPGDLRVRQSSYPTLVWLPLCSSTTAKTKMIPFPIEGSISQNGVSSLTVGELRNAAIRDLKPHVVQDDREYVPLHVAPRFGALLRQFGGVPCFVGFEFLSAYELDRPSPLAGTLLNTTLEALEAARAASTGSAGPADAGVGAGAGVGGVPDVHGDLDVEMQDAPQHVGGSAGSAGGLNNDMDIDESPSAGPSVPSLQHLLDESDDELPDIAELHASFLAPSRATGSASSAPATITRLPSVLPPLPAPSTRPTANHSDPSASSAANGVSSSRPSAARAPSSSSGSIRASPLPTSSAAPVPASSSAAASTTPVRTVAQSQTAAVIGSGPPSASTRAATRAAASSTDLSPATSTVTATPSPRPRPRPLYATRVDTVADLVREFLRLLSAAETAGRALVPLQDFIVRHITSGPAAVEEAVRQVRRFFEAESMAELVRRRETVFDGDGFTRYAAAALSSYMLRSSGLLSQSGFIKLNSSVGMGPVREVFQAWLHQLLSNGSLVPIGANGYFSYALANPTATEEDDLVGVVVDKCTHIGRFLALYFLIFRHFPGEISPLLIEALLRRQCDPAPYLLRLFEPETASYVAMWEAVRPEGTVLPQAQSLESHHPQYRVAQLVFGRIDVPELTQSVSHPRTPSQHRKIAKFVARVLGLGVMGWGSDLPVEFKVMADAFDFTVSGKKFSDWVHGPKSQFNGSLRTFLPSACFREIIQVPDQLIARIRWMGSMADSEVFRTRFEEFLRGSGIPPGLVGAIPPTDVPSHEFADPVFRARRLLLHTTNLNYFPPDHCSGSVVSVCLSSVLLGVTFHTCDSQVDVPVRIRMDGRLDYEVLGGFDEFFFAELLREVHIHNRS